MQNKCGRTYFCNQLVREIIPSCETSINQSCCEESNPKQIPSYCCEKPQPCHYENTSFKTSSIAYQISHAKDVEKVVVSSNREPRVKDLLCEIEKTHNIPFAQQRLVYRGMNLHECPEKKLTDLVVHPMSIIKLTGTRNNYQSSLI
jgi:hypothetical protein